jgi:DNA-binding transcriptional LysR family regulator
MEIGRLEAFIHVATLLSFSKAAEALYLTQPTVTARIQALERELGEPLFERMGRTIRLTDAGKSFLPHAQRALQSIKEGTDAIASLRNVDRGTLSIGTAPTVGTYVLPNILQRYAVQYPGVEVSIRTGRSEEVMAMVLADEVQIGFERYLTHPDIETVELYEDDIYLMASAEHSFAARSTVTVEDVARESVVFFDVGSSYHAISQAIFRDTGVAPRHSLDVDSLEMAKHLVLRGLGLAFLPRVAVERELKEGTVVALKIKGSKPLRRQITLIYRRRRLQSRAMLALLDLLKEIYHFEYPNPVEHGQPATVAEPGP